MRRVSERRARKAVKEHQRHQSVIEEQARTIKALRLKPLNKAVIEAVQQQIREQQRNEQE